MQFSRIAEADRHRAAAGGGGNDTDRGNVDAAAASLQQLQVQNEPDVDDADHYFTNITASDYGDPLPLSYSNWRILTPSEAEAHRLLGEIDPRTGDYTFRTYDLNHVIERRYKNLSVSVPDDGVYDADGDDHEGESPTSTAMELHTVLSTESDGSEEDRNNTSSMTDMENMTARLFRRSELSLRDEAVKKERRAEEEKRRAEEEERERRSEERRREAEEKARCVAEGRKYKRSSSSSSKRGSLKSSSKKLIKSLSSMSSKLNGSTSGVYGRSGSGSVCQNPKLRKKSSAQASAIEKARDLIDEDDGVEDGSVDVSCHCCYMTCK